MVRDDFAIAMMDYTYEELIGMHKMCDQVRLLYSDRFPMRRLPNQLSIVLNWKLCSFAVSNRHLRRSLNVRTPEIEDLVLDRFGAASRTSTQALAAANGAEWSALHEEGLQPFRVQRVQCLNADDNFRRLNFMRLMLQVRANNPQFPAFVLFTDKAQGRI
ncbi:hypothetical protein AVEN_199504-1 [Araneus ventricosus]|uniref:Uncharacterized protein n=1 Tax=Araneus ventricosus TaxID=182803 RepID=A0A4Y2PFM2_ARAVE|nr:hypothetical protein AVEN_36835-1 [Araneus ventricosus]GBN49783.1 hypothetical protein AVEN_199504-1 [Araneus ventricosus]